ncbi:unnamed protein product, partial [Dovyalis caffra]
FLSSKRKTDDIAKSSTTLLVDWHSFNNPVCLLPATIDAGFSHFPSLKLLQFLLPFTAKSP